MLVLVVGDLHLPLRAAALPLKFRKLLVPGKIQQVVCTGNVCDRETWDYLRTIAPDVKGVKGDFDESPHLPQTIILQHGSLRLGVVHGHQILPPGDRDLLHSVATQMDVDILLTGSTHRFQSWEYEGRFYVNPGSATGAWSSHWPLFADAQEGEAEGEGRTKDRKEEAEADKKDEDDNKERDEAADKDEVSDAKAAAPSDDEKKDTQQAPPSAKKPARKPAPPPTPSFVLLDIQGTNVVSYVYQLINGEVKVEKSEYKKNPQASGGAEAAGAGVAVGTTGGAAVMAGPGGGGPGW